MIGVWVGVVSVALLAVGYLLIGARRPGRHGPRSDPIEELRARRDELVAEARLQGADAGDAEALERELALDFAQQHPSAALIEAPAQSDEPGRAPKDPGGTEPRRTPSRMLRGGLALALLAGTAGLYALWGEPDAERLAGATQLLAEAPPDGAADGDARRRELTDLERALARRAGRRPGDEEAWFHLGHARMRLGDHEGAADAFKALHELAGPVEAIDRAWANASFLADGGRLAEATRDIVERVLAERPEDAEMLQLLALDALRRRDFAAAAEYLERALQRSVAPARRRALAGILMAARQRGADAEASSSDGATAATAPKGDGAAATAKAAAEQPAVLVVDVSLGVGADAAAAVFVIARDPAAPRPPVAVRRLAAGDLPQRVRMTDADAMLPGRSLSALGQVEVLARLSGSGRAVAESGDVESSVATVSPFAAAVALRIDRPVP